jgi:hypothetical protein
MTTTEQVSVEQMVAELLAAGWEQYRVNIWISPSGAWFRGPYGAWVRMKAGAK